MLKNITMLTAVALLLVSCGSKEVTDENGGTSNADVGDDVIKVWIPGDEVEYGFYFDMFENYKKHIESEGGTFEYVIEQQPWGDYWTKLPLEINNGRGPDMFLAHNSYMDVLLPISAELDLGDEILKDLDVSGLYVGENGKDKFVPTVSLSLIMFANTDVVGDMTDFPETWAELEELAKQYADPEKGIIGFDFSFNLLEDLQYDDRVTYTKDGEIEFYNPPLERAMKWQEEGITDYFNYGNGSPEKVFNENAVAFTQGATWMEFWAPDDAKARMRAFPVPKDNPDGYYKAMGEPTFGINKNATGEKYELLNDIVKFMLTDEQTVTAIVKGNSGVSNNRTISVEYEPYTAGDAVTKTFATGRTAFAILPSALEDIYSANLEGVLMGEDIDKVTENAKINLDGINVERLSSMEDEFRDSFKQ